MRESVISKKYIPLCSVVNLMHPYCAPHIDLLMKRAVVLVLTQNCTRKAHDFWKQKETFVCTEKCTQHLSHNADKLQHKQEKERDIMFFSVPVYDSVYE